MVLKSYRLKLKKKKKSRSKDLITAGVGAIIGTSFISQTASILNRL